MKRPVKGPVSGPARGPTRGPASEPLRVGSARGRLTLLVTVLASGMAFVDSTAVNVALPRMGLELGADFAAFQWIVNAYLVTLGALVLPAGAMADVFGRRRVFLVGALWFAAASAICGAAPDVVTLVGARAVQGMGAALMLPSSLSILHGCFHPDERGRAIGYWSGFTGLATVIGPLLGGWLVESVSWRAVFLLNPVLVGPIVLLTLLVVPARDPFEDGGGGGRGGEAGEGRRRRRSVDSLGAVTAVATLGALVFFLIQGPAWGWGDPRVVASALLAVVGAVGFVDIERNQARPMLPLDLFRFRRFTGINAVTLVVYFALSGFLFLFMLHFQRVVGYDALEAGAAALPLTFLLLVLSPVAGAWADRRGPREPITAGPVLAAGGLLLLAPLGPGGRYVSDVLPGLLLFGAGLGLTVAPLTNAALAALPERRAGVASGVNDAVARVARLVAIPLLPLAAGLSGIESVGGLAFAEGFTRAMWIAAAVLVGGGALAWRVGEGA